MLPSGPGSMALSGTSTSRGRIMPLRMTAALISLLLGSTISRSIVPTSLPSVVRTLAPSSTRIGCLLSFPVHITCFSIGNIYAILDLGCVVSMSSALAHRASSEQNDEDRDGAGKPWKQIDVWWRLLREARVVWEPRQFSPWQSVVTMS